MKNSEIKNKEFEQLKTANKNKNATKLFMNQYLDIKKNILEFYLENEDLLSAEKKKKRNISHPKPKYIRLHLKKKHENNKYNKKDSQNYFDKNKKENINKAQETKESNNKINIAKVDINNKEQDINQKNLNSNNNKGIEIIKNSGILNKIVNSSSDLYKFFVNDMPSFKNNSSQNINGFKADENNSDINLYNIGDVNYQEGNFSEKSSKNGSNKNVKNNKNNIKSNLSSSSFSRNFVLKSELCKSAFYNDNLYHYNKSNRIENNPIMNYFGQELNNEKNIKNFYLSTAKKSADEIDQINYMNFFPIDEDSSNKLNDIMSCHYIEKDEKPKEIFTEVIENKENDFSYARFQNRENDENIHKLELIKKKTIKYNENNKDDKNNNKIEQTKNEIKIDNNNNNKHNKISDAIETENKTINLVNSSLRNLDTNNTNINNNINNNPNYSDNINPENKTNEKTPLSFVHNIYYINNSNYKQYQINPIYNNTNQNSFYGQNNNNQNIQNIIFQ